MSSLDFDSYISPLSWRYGSSQIKQIFSEKNKYILWRKIWVALAKSQNKLGIVSEAELSDLEKNIENINIEEIQKIELKTKHDVVSAIKEFANIAKIGGGKIHLGATSMDIVDNADMIRYKQAVEIVEKKILGCLGGLGKMIIKYADLPCMGYTHLQPAEPTTVGYRLAFYAQDLLMDIEHLQFVKSQMKGKGMKGAVGTKASYLALVEGDVEMVEKMEGDVLADLDLEAQTISTQVYSRKIDFLILNMIAGVAASLAKFAGDLRILQSPLFGEWSEPFSEKQVGSSAMPFKKNPISSEKICSLARYIGQLPVVALENASLSYLERTLDDSANKRIILPEALIALDEILNTTEKILKGLVINEKRISHNLAQFAPFSATEGIMMLAVKKGADRQKMHEVLREISLSAWQTVQEGKSNPMRSLLLNNNEILKLITVEEIEAQIDSRKHVGDAPERAKKLVEKIDMLTK